MISSWLSRSRQHRISPNASSSSVRASAEIPADSVSEPLSDGARSEAEELARLVIEYEGEALPKSAVRLARRVLRTADRPGDRAPVRAA